jgi:uncharacterized protein
MGPHYLAEGLVISGDRETLGKGVFAVRSFAPGELLAVWGGSIISTGEISKLSENERAYVVQVEEDLHLLTPRAEVASADFINHSCDPNAGLSGSISLVARRAIRPGDEICYDYAMSDSNPFLNFNCQCGSALCRSHISGDDWRLGELQHRYVGYFSPYLQRRMADAVIVPVTAEIIPIGIQLPGGDARLQQRSTGR